MLPVASRYCPAGHGNRYRLGWDFAERRGLQAEDKQKKQNEIFIRQFRPDKDAHGVLQSNSFKRLGQAFPPLFGTSLEDQEQRSPMHNRETRLLKAIKEDSMAAPGLWSAPG